MISMKFRSLSLQLCEKPTFSKIGLLRSFKARSKPILFGKDLCHIQYDILLFLG